MRGVNYSHHDDRNDGAHRHRRGNYCCSRDIPVITSLCEAIAAIGSASRIVGLLIGCAGAQKQQQHTGDK